MGDGNAYTPAKAGFAGDAYTPANEMADCTKDRDLVSLNMAVPVKKRDGYDVCAWQSKDNQLQWCLYL